MSDSLQSILVGGFLVLCVLPIVIVAAIGFVVWRMGRERLDNLLDPSVERLQNRFQALQAQRPSASEEELIGKIIHGQALRCGVVGAITGLGGFYTLPIALPVDIIASVYLQAGLVNFIAQYYGQRETGYWEERMRGYLVVAGSGQVTQTTSKALIGFLVRVAGKSLSKIIPFLGAIISFVVNYLIARGVGQLALQWYAREAGSNKAKLEAATP